VKRIDPKNWLCLRIDAVGAAGCVTFTLLIYFLGLAPLLDARTDLAAEQGTLSQQRQKSSHSEAAVAALKARLAEVEQALTKIQVRLHPARHVNQRIAQVAELAISNGLKIDDVQLGHSSGTSRYTSIPIALAGSGTYRTCTQFLHRLNQALPDTGVTVLELWGNPRSDIEAAAFRMELIWYAAPAGSGPEK